VGLYEKQENNQIPEHSTHVFFRDYGKERPNSSFKQFVISWDSATVQVVNGDSQTGDFFPNS
jgi:hypothetical protein